MHSFDSYFESVKHIAPPKPARLFNSVLSVMIITLSFLIAPPLAAVFFVSADSVMFNSPIFNIAPPPLYPFPVPMFLVNKDFLIINTLSFLILKVAVPGICEMIFITFITAVIHFIILSVSTTDSIAVFENGWRMVTLATEPIMAISTALISIVAANYGAGNYKSIKVAYDYSMKMATLIGIAALMIFLVFATQIAYIFSYGETSMRLLDPTITFFHIFAWFFIVFPGGVISTYVFQGLGKGTHSLIFTVIRELIFAIFFSILYGIVLGWGINGVWFGILVGYTIGGLIAIVYANSYLKNLIKSEDNLS